MLSIRLIVLLYGIKSDIKGYNVVGQWLGNYSTFVLIHIADYASVISGPVGF
jgi:hypothetical protein